MLILSCTNGHKIAGSINVCKCISLLGLKKFAVFVVVVVVVVVTAIKLGWADLQSPGIYFI